MADFEYFRAEESDQFSFFGYQKLCSQKKSLQACLQTQSSFTEFCLIESAYPRKMVGLTVMVMSILFTRLQNCRSCCECRIRQ